LCARLRSARKTNPLPLRAIENQQEGVFDLCKWEREIYISLFKIHKSPLEIHISLSYLYKSGREIRISLFDLCIFSFPTTQGSSDSQAENRPVASLSNGAQRQDRQAQKIFFSKVFERASGWAY